MATLLRLVPIQLRYRSCCRETRENGISKIRNVNEEEESTNNRVINLMSPDCIIDSALGLP